MFSSQLPALGLLTCEVHDLQLLLATKHSIQEVNLQLIPANKQPTDDAPQ